VRPAFIDHLTLTVRDLAASRAFSAAALAPCTDNGVPGPRPRYHSGYSAAFVLDPDGHSVEAVFHGPRD
jgi:catechol 2,3-dioxygenase-like lactoylglutathione lyase family enzyme